MKRDLRSRFLSKFRVTPGCWIWTAALGNSGYGHFWAEGSPQPAHRIGYRLFVGEIQGDLCVLHKCDNRLCVNPDHLFLGTVRENTEDMVQKARQAKGVKSAKAKLTEEQVIAIRNDPRSQRKIGAQYGVSHTVVGHIKNNISWRHI